MVDETIEKLILSPVRTAEEVELIDEFKVECDDDDYAFCLDLESQREKAMRKSRRTPEAK